MKKIISFLLLILSIFISASVNAADTPITWTEEELAFMEENPEIHLGVDPAFVPFEFIDVDKEYKGVASDYIKIIEEKTGLDFVVTPDLTWVEAYDLARNKELDVLPAVSKTVEREQYFLFSTLYYQFKRVIVTRNTETSIGGLEDLDGTTVAVQKNSSHHSYLLSFPEINLSLYDTVEEALTAVANGSEVSFVGNLATTNFLINELALTNLKFIAFKAEEESGLYFAVRNDWPELISIINKVLQTITQEQKMAIHNRWITIDTQTDYGPLIRIIAIISSIILAILGVSFFWIVRLRNEIKKRIQIEQDLILAKRDAEEANEFKSSFMARMSHEIRTPLNAITGMSYLLKKSDVTLTQRMYADRITQASNNMLSIINDILDFSKIEAGKVEIETTTFNLDLLIQNVVSITSYKIEEQGIGFTLSKDPQIPDWLVGDAKRIEQILLNLLNNAAKFTNQGEISLDIRLIAKEDGRYHISFSVKDTGIGMNEEQINKLFHPFVQGDSTINRRFGGSGLGLSIVKNLVELMGGTIQVFSTPNQGSTFIVSLTLAIDALKEEEMKKALNTHQFAHMNTLVLEKSGTNMNLIDSYLNAFGMHCELTSSEMRAIAMLEGSSTVFAKPFDLLIVDYNTPSEGGFHFVEQLRSNNKISKMPKIIMLLPLMKEDLFDQLKSHAIDAGIEKPVIPSILLNTIVDIFHLKAITSVRMETKKETPQWAKSIKVLLAEDNKTNQLIASSLLKQANIETFIADDGQIAVDLFQEHENEIDLILMDLHMPVMNGYEASTIIRQQSEKIPIVAMTADVILGVKEKCEACGMHYYISKPFDPERFIATIVEIIQNNLTSESQPVLNLDKGIKNLGGNRTLYCEVLQIYLQENQETLMLMQNHLLQQDYEKAKQLIHKIKGSSGSIGADLLYQHCVLFQKVLGEGDAKVIEAHHSTFIQLFTQLFHDIKEFMKQNDH